MRRGEAKSKKLMTPPSVLASGVSPRRTACRPRRAFARTPTRAGGREMARPSAVRAAALCCVVLPAALAKATGPEPGAYTLPRVPPGEFLYTA